MRHDGTQQLIPDERGGLYIFRRFYRLTGAGHWWRRHFHEGNAEWFSQESIMKEQHA